MKTQNEIEAEMAGYDETQEDWDGDERVQRKPKFTFPRFGLPRGACGPFLSKRQLKISNPDKPF